MWVVIVLVGLAVAGRLIGWVQDLVTDERAEVVDMLTDRGMSDADAACVADGLEAEYGNVQSLPETRAGVTTMVRLMIGCVDLAGAPEDVSNCVVDALVTRFDGASNDSGELVKAMNDMDSDDRRFIVANMLKCQGATDDVADCIVQGVTEEFGDEFFEQDGRILTAPEQARLEKVQLGCFESET